MRRICFFARHSIDASVAYVVSRRYIRDSEIDLNIQELVFEWYVKFSCEARTVVRRILRYFWIFDVRCTANSLERCHRYVSTVCILVTLQYVPSLRVICIYGLRYECSWMWAQCIVGAWSVIVNLSTNKSIDDFPVYLSHQHMYVRIDTILDFLESHFNLMCSKHINELILYHLWRANQL